MSKERLTDEIIKELTSFIEGDIRYSECVSNMEKISQEYKCNKGDFKSQDDDLLLLPKEEE